MFTIFMLGDKVYRLNTNTGDSWCLGYDGWELIKNVKS